MVHFLYYQVAIILRKNDQMTILKFTSLSPPKFVLNLKKKRKNNEKVHQMMQNHFIFLQFLKYFNYP